MCEKSNHCLVTEKRNSLPSNDQIAYLHTYTQAGPVLCTLDMIEVKKEQDVTYSEVQKVCCKEHIYGEDTSRCNNKENFSVKIPVQSGQGITSSTLGSKKNKSHLPSSLHM